MVMLKNMKRREAIKTIGLTTAASLILPKLLAKGFLDKELLDMVKADFGPGFKWGAATAAYQIEGAWNLDGKGPSIWDTFTHQNGKIKGDTSGDVACDFYHRYRDDISLLSQMNMDVFRFSISWSRILPNGIGQINQKGMDFYHAVIDTCLEMGIEPWITLYHWDLPQALEDKGGWANREIINWFGEYVDVAVKAFGNKVKNWMVFNEPAAFTGLGYMTGTHAPGVKSLGKYPKVIHHVVLCQAEGGRIVRSLLPDANVGTTYSMSAIHPKAQNKKHLGAAKRMDALLNRLFIEPALGLGYPTKDFGYLKEVEKHMKEGDDQKMIFDFDFHGVQNYFRIVATHSAFPPVLWANQVKPKKLVKDETELTDMKWEVYPAGIYEVIKQLAAYNGVKKIYVTENGAAFPDQVEGDSVHDARRVQFFKDYLAQVLKAKNEGAPVDGYFVWSLMDNFEWAEGYYPRFGLVHVDYQTQKRTIKDSGLWFKEFLK
jgi:beta-glucosidase